MSIIIATDVTLEPSADITGDNPVLGYDNRVTRTTVASTTQDTDWPTSNLANPSTYERWQGTALAIEYVTVTIDSVETIDYVAIAAHNLYTAGIQASVEIKATSGGSWVEVLAAAQLPDDGPAVFWFDEQVAYAVRLKLLAGSAVPAIAVLYAGKLTVIPRRLYVGHTPIKYGRRSKVLNGRAEVGHFLGRVIVQESNGSMASFKSLTPLWVRNTLNPFLEFAETDPFFFAWRPLTYPLEVGFAWLTGDVQPVNQASNGLMSVDLPMEGVV